jgi:hypothetical protein
MTDTSAQSLRQVSIERRETAAITSCVFWAITSCVFCLEDIRPGASVCPHCGGVLVPFQRLFVDQAAFEARLAALELAVAALRPVPIETPVRADASSSIAPSQRQTTFGWPHMVDNLFLGLAALLAAHWLATTLPQSNRMIFRLAALAIAMPFGFRFEAYARTGISGRVLAALALGGLGTLVDGVLDIALAGGMPATIGVQDITASVAVITLSHLVGSFIASFRRNRAERQAMETAVAQDHATPLNLTAAVAAIRHVKPDRLVSEAAAVKAVTDAAAALTATAAALWAAFGHLQF